MKIKGNMISLRSSYVDYSRRKWERNNGEK